MKTVFKLLLGGAVISAFFTAGAMAEGTIYTRNADAARADLVRDWDYRATGANAGFVRQRTTAEMHADLIRDWNGPAGADVAAQEKRAVHSRSAQQAYDDLVRNWGG
ncbi:MAG TPA: hypothetical protein VGQ19_03485 [Burkholderiales bacterium]|jgi:hypothetical protein|nr:hypothetical protein [Burkholderiales bacterium]